MDEQTNAAEAAPRGDYSLSELRGMMRGEEPKPAAEPKPATPAAGAKPAESAPASGTETETQASGTQQRGTDGKFKAKEGDTTDEGKEGEAVPAGVQKRIDKAVRAQRDAERRAEDAERKLRESQGSQPGAEKPGAKDAPSASEKQTPPPTRPKPEPAKFNSYEEYISDLTKWTIEQSRAEEQRSEATRSKQQAENEILRSHNARVEKAKETLADFDDVIGGAKDLPISREMHTAIVTSDKGPELAYHLAKNPEEVKRIAALPSNRHAFELGKIEASIEAEAKAKAEAEKPAEKKPPAKPLPKPAAQVGGGGGGAKEQKLEDPEIDMGTFKRLARAALKKAA